MAGLYSAEPFETGFSFENCKRNAFLEAKGYPIPKAQKTGTTIVGAVVKDAVILGADTRATEDTIIADKNCSKIHYLSKNMYCCGAGTAADTEMTTRNISSQLELLKLNTGRVIPVIAATRLLKQLLFRYQGYIGAALIVGGVDPTGCHLYMVGPHGNSSRLPYCAMGSGSLAAISYLESNYKPEMTVDEGKSLIRGAIAAGIFNDLGSGSNIDICVIQDGSVQYLRPYEEPNIKGKKQGIYRFPPGTTAVLKTKIKHIPLEVESENVKKIPPSSSDQPMEVS